MPRTSTLLVGLAVVPAAVAASLAVAAAAPGSGAGSHLAAGAGGISPSPDTSTAPEHDVYVAISLSIDGAYGTAKRSTKEAAYRSAVAKCQDKSKYSKQCIRVGWARDACGAEWYTVDSKGIVSTKKGSSPRFAYDVDQDTAVSEARGAKTDGTVVSVCA